MFFVFRFQPESTFGVPLFVKSLSKQTVISRKVRKNIQPKKVKRQDAENGSPIPYLYKDIFIPVICKKDYAFINIFCNFLLLAV